MASPVILPTYLDLSGNKQQVVPSISVDANGVYADPSSRMSISAKAVTVAANTSVSLIAANPLRKYLQIVGSLATGSSWQLGYDVTATATTSAPFGPAGISLAARWGSGDSVPTNGVNVYSSVAATFYVEEGA